MFYGVRFIEDNHAVPKVLGTTSYKGEAIFVGEDPAVEGIANPEELRYKIPGDYGRDKGIAWYFMGGFSLTWAANATAGQAKVVVVTST